MGKFSQFLKGVALMKQSTVHCVSLALWILAFRPAIAQNFQPTKIKLDDSASLFPAELDAFLSLANKAEVGPQDTHLTVASQGSDRYVVAHLEFTKKDFCDRFTPPKNLLIGKFQQFAEVFVPAGDRATLEKVSRSEGLLWMDFSPPVAAPPPAPELGREGVLRSVAEKVVHGGTEKLTGKGVTIAVIDTGIDFHHPDFITTDAEGRSVSRIRYFWDTTAYFLEGQPGSPAPVSFPNGTPIGTVYSREDLTAELRAKTPRILAWDTHGHGTACAGIAAGNGRALNGKFAGVAPDADIIAVRLGNQFEHGFLLCAICAWLDKLAAAKPLVISCSFGQQRGGRDGNRIWERHLSARFPEDTAGRALCIAAGNDGLKPLHAELKPGDRLRPAVLQWSAPQGAYIHLFIPKDHARNVRVLTLGEEKIVKNESVYHRPSDQVVMGFQVKTGVGSLGMYSLARVDLIIDAYIAGAQAEFRGAAVSQSKMISTPAGTASAITVGSYDFNNRFTRHGKTYELLGVYGKPIVVGQRSRYSSPGPLRGSADMKPEITAPGQYFTAPAARNIDAIRDSSGYYRVFNGTSAATPYTAGIVALMMERDPQLTVREIKGLLKKCASQDEATGQTPNPQWGHGKLDLTAVRKMLESAAE